MTPSIRGALARAKFRKQNAPLQFAFADRIDFLDAGRWDAATAGRGLFLQRGYLRELEQTKPANVEPRYALLCRDGEAVAAMAMQIVSVQGGNLRRDEERAGLRKLVAKVTDRITTRVLVVGNVLTYGNHGIAIRPGFEQDEAVWHGIGEAAYRVRRAEKHSGSADFVLVKDLTKAAMGSSQLMHALGFRAVETEPDMVLALQPKWRTYDDYLAALSSKYRKNVRQRVLTPIAEAGVAVEPIADVARVKERLQELYLAVHENNSLRPVTLGPDYWPALARCSGEKARFAGLVRDGQLLGFVVTLCEDDATAIGYHIGFDRAAAGDLPLYLRLLHRTVEDGIAMGARRLSLGRTALEPKAMLGAEPEPLHVWVRHRQPVLNKLMRALLGKVHHDEAPDRNPFGLKDKD